MFLNKNINTLISVRKKYLQVFFFKFVCLQTLQFDSCRLEFLCSLLMLFYHFKSLFFEFLCYFNLNID